jgi:peptide/nickel transport system ATP-binding protein/oligopeptide transport system ATP-binding protein
VINLMQDLQREFNIAFLFIAHDLAIVRHFCPEIAVMYLGKIVEKAPREELYGHPKHPYTKALLSAAPDIEQVIAGGRRERIRLTGDVPSPINPPSGCRFRTRCWKAQDICATVEPPLQKVELGAVIGVGAPSGATATAPVGTTADIGEVACHFPEL